MGWWGEGVYKWALKHFPSNKTGYRGWGRGMFNFFFFFHYQFVRDDQLRWRQLYVQACDPVTLAVEPKT